MLNRRLAVTVPIQAMQSVTLSLEETAELVTKLVNAIPSKDRAEFFAALDIK